MGETQFGTRRIFYFRRGSCAGPGLQGEVLPGGGDWVLARRDGVSHLDVRMTLRAEDGELILVHSSGMLGMSPDVRRRVLAGKGVDPAE